MVLAEDRAARLAEARNNKMARSPHAYVRGSTASFYQWLGDSRGKVPEGPPVWICGDCHVGNLGPLADAKRRVAVQIRDLDQTVIGNPAHDLIRLGLSLASAARGSGLPGVTTAYILEALVAGYEAGLSDVSAKAQDKLYRPKRIRRLLASATRRRWRHLAQERLDTIKPVLPLGPKFWVLTAEERKGLTELFADDELRAAIAKLHGWPGEGALDVVDAAYWMKGCSSLGLMRYAVMIRTRGDDGGPVRLMDIKEAVAPSAPRAEGVSMPRSHAHRVVAGACALSPNLGPRMLPSRLLGRSVVIRELMPQDLKLEVDRLAGEEAGALAGYLANVVGRAHGGQMEAADRRDWGATLARSRTGGLDAPSWLWSSVVELLSIHEAAYLEHCRRFVLARAA